MSDTLNALFVLFFFLLPGMAGNAIYTKVTGTSWREEPWRNIARILGISLGGLILYVLVGSLLNAPLPGYLSLDTLDTFALRRTASVRMSFAFLGHLIAALIVGFVAAKVSQALGNWTSRSGFVDSWHEFIASHARGNWVVVGLKGGAIYAGYIDMVNPAMRAEERDVVLAEPAVYRAEQEKYLPLPYNYLFLPGKIVDSVAIAGSQPERLPAPMHAGREENRNGH